MNHRTLLTFVSFFVLASCDVTNQPAQNIYETQGSLAPYAVGDKYAFQVYINGRVSDTAHYEVLKDTLIDGEAWQIHKGTMTYTLETSPEPVIDLVRIDRNGLTHYPNLFGLMSIDRSRTFGTNAADSLGMYVNDTTEVSVTAGTFKNAMNFRSGYQYGDRSIYAPGVGMIYRETSDSYMRLLYAVIGGKRYGNL